MLEISTLSVNSETLKKCQWSFALLAKGLKKRSLKLTLSNFLSVVSEFRTLVREWDSNFCLFSRRKTAVLKALASGKTRYLIELLSCRRGVGNESVARANNGMVKKKGDLLKEWLCVGAIQTLGAHFNANLVSKGVRLVRGELETNGVLMTKSTATAERVSAPLDTSLVECKVVRW